MLLGSKYSEIYDIILMRDYNAEITNATMQEFCESYFLENMVKKPTRFKNHAKPACISLQSLLDNNK